ncbi:Jacalin-like lectin domain-containing protein [Neocallimastix sp. 'constans']
MGGIVSPKGDSLYGEVVDKIWFRNGRNIEINAATFELLQTEFTDAEVNQFSDHYPITARIDYKLLENFHTSDSFGGSGGQGFSFLDKITSERLPLSVTISSGDRIDRVGFTYEGIGPVVTGGNGEKEQTYVFQPEEYIVSMRVFSFINLTTNLGNVVSGGKTSNASMTFNVPVGYAITGFIGAADDEIDRLGCIYQKL